MTIGHSEFRGRIREVLALIADPEAQIEYQQNAPGVDVPAELFNQWDDSYHPDDATFQSQFDGSELLALRQFGEVVDGVASETPQRLPALDEFMKTDECRRLSISASQLIAHVILPFGHPCAKASRRERIRAVLLSGDSSSPMDRVGVTSIWCTRTTDT